MTDYNIYTVPRDQFVQSNSRRQFNANQLHRDIPGSSGITELVERLGLRSSGPTNDFVRKAIREQRLTAYTEKWRTPVEPNTAAVTLTSTPMKFDIDKMEQAGRLMLEAMGEDVNRDGLKDTPKRFAKYYSEIMNGHFLDPKDFVTEFDNDGDYDGAVVVKDLPFYTICEHHLAPFIGTWDVAYKPGDRIVGLSKLVRIARVYQKRPQVQERLTKQIAEALNEILKPEWVAVRMQAEHFCMSTRGVRTPGSLTETLTGFGDYPKDVFTNV